jgi:uncharacterized protein YjcR
LAFTKMVYATATKIKKQLEAEGFDIPPGTIENWRRRDKWDGRGGVEALKAVASSIGREKPLQRGPVRHA